MPLSISNSKIPSNRHIVVLLTVCALLCASMEEVTSHLFSRMSHIENRREAEFRHALTLRSAKDRRALSVLVVGNSLLLEGVDFPRLQRDAGSGIELSRAVVENTFYLDWYYGLGHMFRLGAQPDAVVVVLNPVQLTSRAIAGDYSAHFLVDRKDVLRVAKDIGADRNRMSSLELANLSSFYGSRAEIRSWILGKFLPDLPSLTHLFHPAPTPLSPDAFGEVAAKRLTQLRQLCRQYGVELVVVIPPATTDSGVGTILRTAATCGVRVLVPITAGALPLSDYSDSFHLNSRGAGKFTPALAADLRQVFLESSGDRRETNSTSSVASTQRFGTVIQQSPGTVRWSGADTK